MKTTITILFSLLLAIGYAQQKDDYIIFKDLRKLTLEENKRKVVHNGIAFATTYWATGAGYVFVWQNENLDGMLRSSMKPVILATGAASLLCLYHVIRHEQIIAKKKKGLKFTGGGWAVIF